MLWSSNLFCPSPSSWTSSACTRSCSGNFSGNLGRSPRDLDSDLGKRINQSITYFRIISLHIIARSQRRMSERKEKSEELDNSNLLHIHDSSHQLEGRLLCNQSLDPSKRSPQWQHWVHSWKTSCSISLDILNILGHRQSIKTKRQYRCKTQPY